MRMSAAQISKAEDLIQTFKNKPASIHSAHERLFSNAARTATLFKSGMAWELVAFESKNFLIDYLRDARHPEAPDQLRANGIGIADYLGVGSDLVLTEPMVRKFASRFEDFLVTNTAPNKPVALVFSEFRNWLIGAYTAVERSGISPNIQGWYARVLTLNVTHNIILAPDRPLANEPQKP